MPGNIEENSFAIRGWAEIIGETPMTATETVALPFYNGFVAAWLLKHAGK